MLSLPINRQLRRQLIDLPDLVAEAYNALGMQPGRGLSASRSTNPPGSRPPVNLALLALLALLGAPSGTAGRASPAKSRRATPSSATGAPCSPARPAATSARPPSSCCSSTTTPALTTTPSGTPSTSHGSYRRLRAMVGPIARRPLPCVACPDCGQVALTDTDAPELRCAACGTYVTREAYTAAAVAWYAAGA